MRVLKIVLIVLACIVLAAVGVLFLLPQEEEIPHIDPIKIVFSTLPKNKLDKDRFTEKDGLRYYGNHSQAGIDVSSHQGEIDWETVKESGVDFAIIRAAYRGYTKGGLSMDSMFAQNIDGAAKAGLQVGVYVFSQAISAEEAAEEAEFVLQCLDGREIDLPIYFDWEYVEGKSRTEKIGGDIVTAAAETFCAAIEKAGYKAGVYFNKTLGYTVLDLERVRQYEFWLADYQPVPNFYFAFTTLQYSDSGTVPGISKKVDLNLRFP